MTFVQITGGYPPGMAVTDRATAPLAGSSLRGTRAGQLLCSESAGPRSLLARATGWGHAAVDAGASAVDLAARAVRAMADPAMLAGTATEAVWIAAHVATYPFGILSDAARPMHGYRVEHLGPVQRGMLVHDVEAAATPILLVHGLVDNRSVFNVLRIGLQRRGFGQITTMNYSPLSGDIRTVAAHLAEEVDRLCEETGFERIHLIGHSLGGLIARYYVTRLGGDERVHTVVTLGTPHHGTYAAYVWRTAIGRQLRPDSAVIRELDRPAPGCRTRFLAYWSDLDEVILPHENAALNHPDLDVRNVRLHGVGHASLPNVRSVVYGIAAALAHLDSAGHLVTDGATPLAAQRSTPAGRATRR